MSFPEAEKVWVPHGRSVLVRELVRLRPPLRRTLGVSDPILFLLDVAVTACAILSDDSDQRPLEERCEDFEDLLNAGIEWSDVEAELARLGRGEEEFPRWFRNLPRPGAALFLQRILGAALYHRFEAAFKADLAIIVVGMRRGIRSGLHYATALDRCISALPSGQIAKIAGLDALAKCSFLQIAVDVDAALDNALELDLPMDTTSVRPLELGRLPGALNEIAQQLDQKVSADSERSVRELNVKFVRKLRGATDALNHSADPISQASNSLIELLDRLLRDAFPEDEVLAWIGENVPARWEGLTYSAENGGTRPTKRGQALCFVYAAQPLNGYSVLHEAAASALVSVRRQLQQLKHADLGSPAEQEAVLRSVSIIESLLLLVFQLVWRGVDDDALSRVRGRLQQAVA
jgi:hypothetical protein